MQYQLSQVAKTETKIREAQGAAVQVGQEHQNFSLTWVAWLGLDLLLIEVDNTKIFGREQHRGIGKLR